MVVAVRSKIIQLRFSNLSQTKFLFWAELFLYGSLGTKQIFLSNLAESTIMVTNYPNLLLTYEKGNSKKKKGKTKQGRVYV